MQASEFETQAHRAAQFSPARAALSLSAIAYGCLNVYAAATASAGLGLITLFSMYSPISAILGDGLPSLAACSALSLPFLVGGIGLLVHQPWAPRLVSLGALAWTAALILGSLLAAISYFPLLAAMFAPGLGFTGAVTFLSWLPPVSQNFGVLSLPAAIMPVLMFSAVHGAPRVQDGPPVRRLTRIDIRIWFPLFVASMLGGSLLYSVLWILAGTGVGGNSPLASASSWFPPLLYLVTTALVRKWLLLGAMVGLAPLVFGSMVVDAFLAACYLFHTCL